MLIPFNKPVITGNESKYIFQVLRNRNLSGDGEFTKKCSLLLENSIKAKKVLLTTSCTHALEMAAILIGLGPGDEVILPSFTFSSTANAICLRMAKPIFVDIRPDTLNIDEKLIEKAITPRTKAIFVVHYAGIGCNMAEINKIAKKYGLIVVEDAAQGIGAKYKGKYLGTIGSLGTYSFHESKNLGCGEGGALIINDERYVKRAEIIREKGTNRSQFCRGEINKYTWVDIGSSFLPSEILAAFLYAQLEDIKKINQRRLEIFTRYQSLLAPLENQGKIKLPVVPTDCLGNGHLFYIIAKTEKIRNHLLEYLKLRGIGSVFHYIPLHSSPMGKSFGNKEGQLPVTESISGRLLRLPIYYDLSDHDQTIVINAVINFFKH